MCAQSDHAVFGELHRITGKVDQNLANAQGVATQDGRNDGVNVIHQFQPFALGFVVDQVADLGEDLVDFEVGLLNAHLAGFNLRNIKNVVDDAEQMLRGICHLFELLGLLGIDFGAAQQVRHADDGVHRRANFMAHVGQEGALGAVGGFGGIACGHQFGGAGNHLLFKMLAVPG